MAERDHLADLERLFAARFGEPPERVVRAPGRVNIIGEHTDYNDGFVLPMAIDREVRIALRRRRDRHVAAVSLDLADEVEFDLQGLERGRGWAEYLKGVAWALAESGVELTGFDAMVTGNVPRGSGLSSSAALELAAARAFHAVGDFEWEPLAMALICRRAENGWLGVASGIMDQLASAAGSAGNALLIDCRSLAREPVPLPSDTVVLVLDTATRRGLVDSAYNQRRAECDEAARLLGVGSLREIQAEDLEGRLGGLDPLLARRARHVVTENERTLQAARAMRAGEREVLGRLMNESHDSLRDDFEVSSEALDVMVECARQAPGCFGARLTGAGFGGCAVALVEAQAARSVSAAVTARYGAATGRDAVIYACRAAPGAGDVSLA